MATSSVELRGAAEPATAEPVGMLQDANNITKQALESGVRKINVLDKQKAPQALRRAGRLAKQD
jgi:hypothetical protein